jgi:predicted GH43/DUF377 family glycosyl hydrolase
MKIKLTISLLLCAICLSAQNSKVNGKGNRFSMDSIDLFSMAQPIPTANFFSDTAYNIWCGSVTKAKNGKFYMFYSRWKRELGHEAWITHSEIALAKADKPEGPYRHIKVILPARDTQYWDGTTTHNPAILKYKGKFYLYYMGSTGKSYVKPRTSYENPAWWEYRNNQRIGVAVADNPEGTWQRFDKPVLDVSPDSTAHDALMVSNPAITVDDKGRFILVYKQVEKKTAVLRGGKVRFGVAFSKSPIGNFVKHDKPIFEAKDGANEWMVAEDPFIWHQKGVNYAIVRDVVGKFTGESGALALMVSTNGVDWQAAKHAKVLANKIYWENGQAFEDKLERPCLYMVNGVPTLLFGAMGFEKRKYSVNVAVPLK